MTERKLHVLVVDDSAAMGRAIHRILRPYEVTCVTSVRAALTLVFERAVPFDAIVCDVHLPEMNGEDFLAVLAAASPSLAAKVVFMTGDTSRSSFLDRIVNERLEKPFSAVDLRDAIGRNLTHANAAAVAPDVRRAS